MADTRTKRSAEELATSDAGTEAGEAKAQLHAATATAAKATAQATEEDEVDSDDPDAEDAVPGSRQLPRKGDYRQRAHVNPMSMHTFDYPITPDAMDWNQHYPNMNGREVEFADIGCGYGGLLTVAGHGNPAQGLRVCQGQNHSATGSEYVKDKITALRERHPGRYNNVACIRGNAMKYLPCFFRKGQLSKVFFLFPDPHFKRTKHKWRIISNTLLAEYAYAIRVGGIIYTVTDVHDLHEWMRTHLEQHPLFRRLTEEELAADPVVPKLFDSSEEGKKHTPRPMLSSKILPQCVRSARTYRGRVAPVAGRVCTLVARGQSTIAAAPAVPRIPRTEVLADLTGYALGTLQLPNTTALVLTGGKGSGKSALLMELLGVATGSQAASVTAATEGGSGSVTLPRILATLPSGTIAAYTSRHATRATARQSQTIAQTASTNRAEARVTVAFDFSWPMPSVGEFIDTLEAMLLISLAPALKLAGIRPDAVLGLAERCVGIQSTLDGLYRDLNNTGSIRPLQPAEQLIACSKLLKSEQALSADRLARMSPSSRDVCELWRQKTSGASSLFAAAAADHPAHALIHLLVTHEDAAARRRHGLAGTSGIPALRFLLSAVQAVHTAPTSSQRILMVLLNMHQMPQWLTSRPDEEKKLFQDYHDALLLTLKRAALRNELPPVLMECDDPIYSRDIFDLFDSPATEWLDQVEVEPFEMLEGDRTFVQAGLCTSLEYSEAYSVLGGHVGDWQQFLSAYWLPASRRQEWEALVQPGTQLSPFSIALRSFVSDRINQFLSTTAPKIESSFLAENAVFERALQERLGKTLTYRVRRLLTPTSSRLLLFQLLDVVERFVFQGQVRVEDPAASAFYNHPATTAMLQHGLLIVRNRGTLIVPASRLASTLLVAYCRHWLDNLSWYELPRRFFIRYITGVLSLAPLPPG
ncbi:hypothetical protein CAOG_08599 [Capsaspora owczarzaki ATCC 30864]|uniref:tRNA (guanine-N(7)-)-methyltransferase n=1 Tax=Capsaspora owczarzaki (strain ATCC 30864) TaxID=595528 RepID=A0A0D2X1Q5_CAPO3|nr:hypothetical protein CAOG_08599 [Capsaspora owczarzaki ATCC 30864]KJE91219.1 hypothetical protein CAOG_008599 [Capsaspora owczarzaki ATCC 30864]|eukprot:XP_011270199.1 hypothetical protein CAOG_08599 [Capsaspora owczarzaki ATCC 30864]